MPDRDDLVHYMEATARMRERAEKAEADLQEALDVIAAVWDASNYADAHPMSALLLKHRPVSDA